MVCESAAGVSNGTLQRKLAEIDSGSLSILAFHSRAEEGFWLVCLFSFVDVGFVVNKYTVAIAKY